jgi:hypothetical protein
VPGSTSRSRKAYKTGSTAMESILTVSFMQIS